MLLCDVCCSFCCFPCFQLFFDCRIPYKFICLIHAVKIYFSIICGFCIHYLYCIFLKNIQFWWSPICNLFPLWFIICCYIHENFVFPKVAKAFIFSSENLWFTVFDLDLWSASILCVFQLSEGLNFTFLHLVVSDFDGIYLALCLYNLFHTIYTLFLFYLGSFFPQWEILLTLIRL